jgi:hypothetical protein
MAARSLSGAALNATRFLSFRGTEPRFGPLSSPECPLARTLSRRNETPSPPTSSPCENYRNELPASSEFGSLSCRERNGGQSVNLGNFVREKLRLGAEIRRNRHPITCSPQNDVVVIGGRNRRENKISGDKISGETKGRRMASPEDEQALDAMNLEERRAHALRHGFVLDDSVADPDLLAQDGFPWEHVEASRRNRRLQKKHPMTVGGVGISRMPKRARNVRLLPIR